jgi:hypothetical protein
VSEYERARRVSLHHRQEEEQQQEEKVEPTSDADGEGEEPRSGA